MMERSLVTAWGPGCQQGGRREMVKRHEDIWGGVLALFIILIVALSQVYLSKLIKLYASTLSKYMQLVVRQLHHSKPLKKNTCNAL